MKIVHIESGLGNQMLSFCEYLALKQCLPEEEIYIENIIYDISECNEVICQWNGYELERIFGINVPNIKEKFSESEWQQLLNKIKASNFWDKNWNYPVYFCQAFEQMGLTLKNIRGDFENCGIAMTASSKKSLSQRIKNCRLGDWFSRYYFKLIEEKKLNSVCNIKNVFLSTNEDIFTGQWLSFKLRNNDIEKIDALIRQTFIFPEFSEQQNIDMSKFLAETNSVAIHARRGDMLGFNGYCYKYGYFRRAVKHIKKHVSNPVFVFFCDPGSVEWCKENEKVFGLNFAKDKVYFVDWNKGESSYRDMQLMAMCKHAIITNSSFGWWGAYLIKNKDKITISPHITINTTYHC